MADAGATTPAASADTGGWDVVHAITFSELNAQITAGKAWPAAFDYGDPGDPVNDRATGTFGDWKLLTGSGTTVTLSVGIRTVHLIVDGAAADYAGLDATVDLDLDWVTGATASTATHVPCPGDTKAPGPHDLKVASGNPPTVTGVSGPKVDPNSEAAGALIDLVGGWLAEHPEAFTHVFATADIAAQLAAAEHLQWLMPTSVAYAVAEPLIDAKGTTGEPIFGVLAMTECHPPTGLHALVSPAAIPANATSALLISRDQFAQHFVLASVPALFASGTTTADFELVDGVVSNRKSLALQDWKLDNGDIVTPVIDPAAFSITVRETTLDTAFTDIEFDYSSAECHTIYNNSGSLYLTDDGHLDIRPIRATVSSEAIVPDRTQLAWIMADIGITIFTIACGAVAAGVGAAAEGAAEATEEGVEVAETVIPYTEDATTLAGADAGSDASGLSQAQAEAMAVAAGSSDFWTYAAGALPRLLLRLGKAIGIAVLMAAPGMVVAAIPQILQAVANGQVKDLPGLNEFTDYGVSPVTWTGLPDRVVVSAELHGSLVIGLAAKTTGGST